MPFTFAHPAAIVPLARIFRGPYAVSALVVGSMAPDFEYFLRLRPVDDIGHSVAGLLVFCLPVGLLVLGLFHWLVKQPAILLLPQPLHRRLYVAATARPAISAPYAFGLAVLVVVAAATHLVWDSFTHQGGWVVQRVPTLSATVVTVAGIDVRTYKLLQHSSTLAGLSILVWAATRWVRRQPPTATVISLPAPVRNAVVGAIISVSLGCGVLAGVSVGQMRIGVVRFVVVAIAGFATSLLAYSLIYRGYRASFACPSDAPN